MKKTKKDRIWMEVKDVLLVLLGCLVLAIADAFFIIPNRIVNGGVDSIGILVNYFFAEKVGFDLSDLVVALVQILLWLLGLCFLGRRFSFHTLLGTLAFPAFYSLLLRTNLYHTIGLEVFFQEHGDSLSALLLAALFGGGLSGIGVALTYLGDGSTGGTDILCFIIEKYASISQDLSGFVLDTLLIVLALVAMRDWGLWMVGILSAVICAVAVRLLYVNVNNSVVCNVVTSKPELVNEFIQKRLNHGTTLLEGSSGHSGEKKQIVRSVLYRKEADDLKNYIALVDPDAFLTLASLDDTIGNGFTPLKASPRNRRKLLRKYGVTIKEKKVPTEEKKG